MPENMMCSGHKATNGEYRDGYDRVFGEPDRRDIRTISRPPSFFVTDELLEDWKAMGFDWRSPWEACRGEGR